MPGGYLQKTGQQKTGQQKTGHALVKEL